MPTVVQVESHPEYLKFPNRCVCCNRLDERNLEMAISSTDAAERENYEIFEVELPYCLECHRHVHARSPGLRIVAIALVVSLSDVYSFQFGTHSGLVVLAATFIVFFGYLAWEWSNLRKLKNPACSAMKNHVAFVDPTSSHMSTLVFSNDLVARSFKELNRYNLVER